MKVRTRHLFSAAMWVTLLLLPSRVWACACCAHPGEYQINFVKPDAYKLSVMERMRLGTTAYLFTGEAEPDDAAKGLAHPADTYLLSGSLVGNAWKLTFRNGDESGTLNLALPAKMLRYAADIHDGRTKPGYPEPVLYKEWRFEGEVNGTGRFQGRNRCPNQILSRVSRPGQQLRRRRRFYTLAIENHRQKVRLLFLR